MEDHEDHREDTRYTPLTRQQIIEDEKYMPRLVESFMESLASHDGTAERKVMVIIHRLIRPLPAYLEAGSELEELVFPALRDTITSIQKEHRDANTDWSNDPNK